MSWLDEARPGETVALGSPDFYTVNADGSLTPGAWAEGLSADDVRAVEAHRDGAVFTVDEQGRSRVLGLEASARWPRLVLLAALAAVLLLVVTS